MQQDEQRGPRPQYKPHVEEDEQNFFITEDVRAGGAPSQAIKEENESD